MRFVAMLLGLTLAHLASPQGVSIVLIGLNFFQELDCPYLLKID